MKTETRPLSTAPSPGSGSPDPAHEGPRALLPSPQRLALFARFIGVGLLNTAFGYALYAAFFLATGSYALAIVLALSLVSGASDAGRRRRAGARIEP